MYLSGVCDRRAADFTLLCRRSKHRRRGGEAWGTLRPSTDTEVTDSGHDAAM